MKAPKTPPAPAAPDPMATATAQTGMNRDTAITQQQLNMVDQYTPDGSLTYRQDGFNTFTDANGRTVQTPRYVATQTLSPDQQRLNDLNNQTQEKFGKVALDQAGRIGDTLSVPVDFGSPMAQPDKLNFGNAFSFGSPMSQPPALDYGKPFDLGQPMAQPDKLDYGKSLDLGQFSYNNLPGLNNSDVEGRLIDLGRTRLDPKFAQDEEALRTRLKNSGIQQGSEAWDREFANMNQGRNDAYNSLLLQGRQQAAQEALQQRQQLGGEQLSQFNTNTNAALQQRQLANQELLSANQTNFDNALRTKQQNSQDATTQRQIANQEALSKNQTDFNNLLNTRQQNSQEALSQRQLANNEAQTSAQFNFDNALRARQQNIQELLSQRNQPINEITALMSGSQVSQPSFTNTPQTNVGGVDYSGLVQNNYNQQLAQYNLQNQQRQQQQQAMMGGLFSLGATAATLPFRFSDRRLKTDVERIGTMANGLPLYSFRYVWGGPMQTGVMADEVMRVRPDAVRVVGGYMAVDYSALGG